MGGVGQGARAPLLTPPPPKKKIWKTFFEQSLLNMWAFFMQKSRKIRDFC